MNNVPMDVLAALVGLVGGLVLGLAARLGDFCTLGALESAAYGKDQRRLRLWGVVLAVAISGAFLAEAAGWADLGATFYHSITWVPAASIVGGLIFGYGMALAGNCGFGALVRFGGGDLRSLVVVVVMGIFAFVTLSGPLGPLRTLLFEQTPATAPQGIAHWLAARTGVAPLLIALPVAAGFLIWGLAYAPLRADKRRILWGIAAGLAIVWCLVATSSLNRESFGAVGVEAPSFTAPLGRTILYFMTSTAGGITFSVGLVAGVLAGSFSGSLIRGLFRWEACEDPRELGRQVSGAALMGIGGTIALGCSIGQGVSAMSVLAFSAPVTLAAIVIGGLFGLRQMIHGFQPD
ncbi:YeeE/YedE family protein [Pseudothioclava nitratireducens]|uniref:YeeE/YedE family protein n=1 Tax=Pseudothioclava nitratireducens TaxID=1928646 RepID=UPI0023DA3B66|nr:YeeE/YedE family protein [Defluviimonas nitratireducens]MDF1619407.1 YeeE/YedE family protein [Defluviimonas nitratireducens]